MSVGGINNKRCPEETPLNITGMTRQQWGGFPKDHTHVPMMWRPPPPLSAPPTPIMGGWRQGGENGPWVWLGVEDTESSDVETMLLKSARVSGQQDKRKKSTAVADF